MSSIEGRFRYAEQILKDMDVHRPSLAKPEPPKKEIESAISKIGNKARVRVHYNVHHELSDSYLYPDGAPAPAPAPAPAVSVISEGRDAVPGEDHPQEFALPQLPRSRMLLLRERVAAFRGRLPTVPFQHIRVVIFLCLLAIAWVIYFACLTNFKDLEVDSAQHFNISEGAENFGWIPTNKNISM